MGPVAYFCLSRTCFFYKRARSKYKGYICTSVPCNFCPIFPLSKGFPSHRSIYFENEIEQVGAELSRAGVKPSVGMNRLSQG